MTRLLQLSDLHLTATGRDEDGVDALASLRRLLTDCRFLLGVDAVVVSGDLSDDASAAGYQAARTEINGFAGARRIPQIYAVGNHDRRVPFGSVLGAGHLDAAGAPCAETIFTGGCAAASYIGGLRVVTLDSLVEGSGSGRLEPEQLTWLRTLLADPAAEGTVLVFHHPPIGLSGYAMEPLVLENPADLADAIAGTDVRAILCGHLHSQLSGALAGVPVWVTPGVVTRIDLSAPPHLVRGVLGASATVIDLPPAGPPLFHLLHARDPHAGDPVYLYDMAARVEVAEEAPRLPA